MSPKEQMIATALALFRHEGYQATSWRKLIQASGAPWGSAHHYFPGGKEELGVAAVEVAASTGAAAIAKCFAECATAQQAVLALFDMTREQFAAQDFKAGCPVAVVTLEMAPKSAALTAACDAAFGSWRRELARGLAAHHHAAERAEELAFAILAMLEGCFVLARAAQSPQAFEMGRAAVLAILQQEAQTLAG
ncbi:TetR/AcrR family transcriptional regulator [Cupriavidus sp. 30B13]|uniref:TetR/AcrR family transcriptional regulator n=1 Tax=Cupriavidus sp. 30B13 TaxID=3384241 RepID=UPI003B920DBF